MGAHTASRYPRDLTDQQWDLRGYLDVQETFIDGSFAPAKRGGACVGKTKRGKGSKIMAIAESSGMPVRKGVSRR
jgi:hypothetical protein